MNWIADTMLWLCDTCIGFKTSSGPICNQAFTLVLSKLWDKYCDSLEAPIKWGPSILLYEDQGVLVRPTQDTQVRLDAKCLLVGFTLDVSPVNSPCVSLTIKVNGIHLETLKIFKGCPMPSICYIQNANYVDIRCDNKCMIIPIRVRIPTIMFRDIEEFMFVNSHIFTKENEPVFHLPHILKECTSDSYMRRKKTQWTNIILEELVAKAWAPKRLRYCLDMDDSDIAFL
jgi:hypothetical protein